MAELRDFSAADIHFTDTSQMHSEPEFVVCSVEIAGFNVVAGEREGISGNRRNGFVGACGGVVMNKSVAFGTEVKLLLIVLHNFADNGKGFVAEFTRTQVVKTVEIDVRIEKVYATEISTHPNAALIVAQQCPYRFV